MYLANPKEIPDTIAKAHFTIFDFPKNLSYPVIKKAINISPNEKNTITVEDIHNIENITRTKQTAPLTILISHADRMTEAAQNCFLKLLEEPGNQIHFVFFTHHSNQLLPTILSRAHTFQFKQTVKIDLPPDYDPKIIASAKQYISATPRQLAALSQSLAKDRSAALEMLDAATDLLYRSYFKTGNPKFLDKLANLLKTHENITKNGHVRLQLVAGMI